jgi:stage V sporulation protein R
MSNDLKRMIKIEERIMQIATEDYKLDLTPVEFDIIPPQKMIEIMSYRIPSNISNWKFGRDYERLRTIHENINEGLPYEVVINSDPARAYLMKSNPFAVQILVMAHVIGHVAFFTMNRYFKNSRKDIIEMMLESSKRISKYESMYGLDEIEQTVDAGHSLQFHSSPFHTETEKEKIRRIFEQEKQMIHKKNISEYSDISSIGITQRDINEDIELFNQKLLRKLKLKTPVEPTEDILRYIIDNSGILEDWQKDILEMLRSEGQYFWPMIKTKFMNEGFATYIHEHIMDQLFREGLLTASDHAQYNFSNSLVKAEHPKGMNPYLIGSKMWKDIEDRWNKGKHGPEWENCTDAIQKEEWDTKDMKGYDKIIGTMKSYTDWFFMQEFLTAKLVKDMKLYIYMMVEQPQHYDYVITMHQAEEIRKMIVNSFAHSGIPKIEVVNGNLNDKGKIYLVHRWSGANLDKKYAEETMKHIYRLWGKSVILDTKVGEKNVQYIIRSIKESLKPTKSSSKIWGQNTLSSPLLGNNYHITK